MLGTGDPGIDKGVLEEVKEIDRLPPLLEFDPMLPLAYTFGVAVAISECSMSGLIDFVHDRSSKPSPTSTRSAAGNCGLGGSDLGTCFLLFREPIDLNPFNFLLVEGCFSRFCWGDVDDPFNLSKMPLEAFRFPACNPFSCVLRLYCPDGLEFVPNVLLLSKRPSKSPRSSYSLKVLEPMLGRGLVSPLAGDKTPREPLGRGEGSCDFRAVGAVYPMPS